MFEGFVEKLRYLLLGESLKEYTPCPCGSEMVHKRDPFYPHDPYGKNFKCPDCGSKLIRGVFHASDEFKEREEYKEWKARKGLFGVRVMSAAAEGSQLENCYPGVNTDHDGTDEHIPLSGKSMAAPHAAAALLLERGVPSGLSRAEYVKSALISTADDLGPEYGVYGQGRQDRRGRWGGNRRPDDSGDLELRFRLAGRKSDGRNIRLQLWGGKVIDLSAELSERISEENCSEFATVSPEEWH